MKKNPGDSRSRKKDLRRFEQAWQPCLFYKIYLQESIKMLGLYYDKLMRHIEKIFAG